MNGKAVTNQEKALKLSISGLTNKEIADELSVSEATASRWVNEQRSVELEELTRALKASHAALESMKADRNNIQAAFVKANEDLSELRAAFNEAETEKAIMKAALTEAREQQEAMKAMQSELEDAGEQYMFLRQSHERATDELNELRKELRDLSQTRQHLANAQAQLKQMREVDEARKKHWFINLFKGEGFMTLIVLIGGVSVAAAITAPIFIAVGVSTYLAYALAVFVDIAAFIFVLNNRHRLGVGFSIATAVQALIKLGGLNWMEPDGLIIVKAAVLAVALGLATYGFSDLIASKKENH